MNRVPSSDAIDPTLDCGCASHLPSQQRRNLMKGMLAAPLVVGPCASAFALSGTSETGPEPTTIVDAKTHQAEWQQLIDAAPGAEGHIERIETFVINPDDMPWQKNIGNLKAGQQVSFFLDGLWWLSKDTGRWLQPGLVFFVRVGGSDGNSRIWNAMQNTTTFSADRDGQLQLARSVAQFGGPDGKLWIPEDAYRDSEGRIEGVAIVWKDNAMDGLLALSRQGDVRGQLHEEFNRMRWEERLPEGWRNHFSFGAGGLFTEIGKGNIDCWTHKDVGILQYPLTGQPLQPGLRLDWRWQVDHLPTDQPEDQLLYHDYLSVAIEFDDGQDLTYFWSSGLPVGKVFRCPIPGWHEIETHVVQRSGTEQLGQMLDEQRDIYQDYQTMIGGDARQVVAVWLIANTLFNRGFGRCRIARMALGQPDRQQTIV